MIEKIQNEELKKYVEEEIEYGMKLVKYENDEKEESVWLDGLGHIQTKVFLDKEKNQVMECNIDKSTNTAINFSDWTIEAREDISYYWRRDYKFISIDDIKNPKYIAMHNVSYGGEILELEYDNTFKRLKPKTYDMDKVKLFNTYFDKIEEKVHEHNKKMDDLLKP